MNLENKQALREIIQEFSLNDLQSEQFKVYVNLLESWSSRTNLVSKNDVTRIVSKHIYESLEVERKSLLSDKKNVLDLGSGAGFPGLPLAVLHPDLKFTLIDSRRIKSLFLHEVVDECRLDNVRVVCDRVEDFGAISSIQYDLVLSRAVAALDILWQWAAPLLSNDGVLVAMKGGDAQDEIDKLLASADVKAKVHPFKNDHLSDFSLKKIVVAALR